MELYGGAEIITCTSSFVSRVVSCFVTVSQNTIIPKRELNKDEREISFDATE